MEDMYSRTQRLLGRQAVQNFQNAHIALYGVGGVGGYAAEALARAGVGSITLFDADTVSVSNLNRQIIALHSTVGQKKVLAAKARIADINPACRVQAHDVFLTPDNMAQYPVDDFDFIIDAIDTVSAKIALIEAAQKAGVPIICAMGCGNKLYAEGFTVTDLFQTHTDALARVMRRELRKRGITSLPVVYSAETPLRAAEGEQPEGEKPVPGSVPWVPGAAGLVMAGYVLRAVAAGTAGQLIR